MNFFQFSDCYENVKQYNLNLSHDIAIIVHMKLNCYKILLQLYNLQTEMLLAIRTNKYSVLAKWLLYLNTV